VAGGGTLVTGFMSGIVDESDNVRLGGYPGPLRKLSGVWAEEIDALAPGQVNALRFEDGEEAVCSLLCDILHPEGAEVLARYANNFYAGGPAVTRNVFGKGAVYYVGAQLEPRALSKVLAGAAREAGVQPLIDEATKLEVTRRVKDGAEYDFVINLTGEPQKLPACFAGKADLLTGSRLEAGTALEPWDTLLVREG
jgi:beta-galactosidase